MLVMIGVVLCILMGVYIDTHTQKIQQIHGQRKVHALCLGAEVVAQMEHPQFLKMVIYHILLGGNPQQRLAQTSQIHLDNKIYL